MSENAVKKWFGRSFLQLDPLLQKLHQQASVLNGKINVGYPPGLAGMLGKRLGRKMGIPVNTGTEAYEFTVSINHDSDNLYWDRHFAGSSKMRSSFKPFGNYPDGYWQEKKGLLKVKLQVQLRDGGWYWVQRGLSIGGVPLPTCLLPEVKANKRIEHGKYLFQVKVVYPLLGELLHYEGQLSVMNEDNK